jgi:hypothetical protein
MFGVRRLAGIAAILLLLAIAIVIVTAAFLHNRGHHGAAQFDTPEGRIGAPTTVSVTQHAARATAVSRRPEPLVSLGASGSALFAQAGCRRPPNLLGSINAGLTWLKLPAPAPHLLWLQLTGKRSGFVVGADSACAPARYVGGAGTWTPPLSARSSWFGSPAGVHAPNGRTSKPCGSSDPQPVSLTAVGTKQAIVVCAHGLYLTTTGGRQWTVAGDIPDGHPVSAALTTQGRGVLVLSGETSCSGLRVATTTDSGLTWQAGACLAGITAPAGVGLAPSGIGMVTTGHPGSYYSTDGGTTWQSLG